MAKKKTQNRSWQFLASVHKTRVAFVNGNQKTPRETKTSGYQRGRERWREGETEKERKGEGERERHITQRTLLFNSQC